MKVIKNITLSSPELSIYSSLNEVQLLRFYEPAPGLFICESPKVIRRALDAGYEPVSLLFEPKYLDGEDADILSRIDDAIPAYLMSSEEMSKLTGYHLTGGMLCAMRRKELPPVEALCWDARRIAVLDNIENPTNIGAIFRSAAAMKIDTVLLTVDCSDSLYRRAARVSVGTVFQIPWTYLPKDQTDYIPLLHELGFQVAGMALSDNAVSIDDPQLKQSEKLAIVLGNEGDGLPEERVHACDFVVKIPMAEGIDSLNVAAASAVAFWELGKA